MSIQNLLLEIIGTLIVFFGLPVQFPTESSEAATKRLISFSTFSSNVKIDPSRLAMS
jgi:hypothetical protein